MQSPKYATLLVCLIVAMLASTVLSWTAARRCKEGQTHFDECNNCTCIEGQLICGSKLCLVFDQTLGKEVSIPLKDPPASFWEPADEPKYPVP